jgi:hypothetical protein
MQTDLKSHGKPNLKTQCVLELKSKGKELVICCMDLPLLVDQWAVVGERFQEE